VIEAGVDVLGTDSEEEIIEQAKIRENNRLKFIQLDVTLPFTFATPFECVYTRNLMHYFNNTEQQFILEQINSVLVASGLLVLQLKSKDDIFYTSKHYKKIIQNDGMHYFPQFRYSRNHLSEQETVQLLDLAGFDLQSISSSSEVLYNDEHESTIITAIARKKEVEFND
jgi:CheR methyltransferase, SAM binding domain